MHGRGREADDFRVVAHSDPRGADLHPSTATSRNRDAAAKRTPSGIFARPKSAFADFGLAHEKGGVVRRPFSKLLAWLIAVSPNRESLSLSARPDHLLNAATDKALAGTRPRSRHLQGSSRSRFARANLDLRAKKGTERGSRQAPALSVPGKLLHGGTAPSPLSDLTRVAAASLPVVSDRTVVDSPAAGDTRARLTAPSCGVDYSA
jgi:hypothetical protein